MNAPTSSKQKRREALRSVFRYLGKYRGRLALGAASLLAADLLVLASPWIFYQVWAFIGGKQLPSVIYKVRMVALQDRQPAVGVPITRIDAVVHGR